MTVLKPPISAVLSLWLAWPESSVRSREIGGDSWRSRRRSSKLGQEVRASREASANDAGCAWRGAWALVEQRLGRLEAGSGGGAPCDVWFALAKALDRYLRFEFARDPQAELADAGHLDIQELVLRVRRSGGWERLFEARSRRLRVGPVGGRQARRHAAAAGWSSGSAGTRSATSGAATRSSERKLQDAEEQAVALAGDGEPFQVGLVWIVRDTKANRALVNQVSADLRGALPGLVGRSGSGRSRNRARRFPSAAGTRLVRPPRYETLREAAAHSLEFRPMSNEEKAGARRDRLERRSDGVPVTPVDDGRTTGQRAHYAPAPRAGRLPDRASRSSGRAPSGSPATRGDSPPSATSTTRRSASCSCRDLQLPHLWDIAAAFGQPFQRNADYSLGNYLLDQALYTWTEAIIGFAVGATIGIVLASHLRPLGLPGARIRARTSWPARPFRSSPSRRSSSRAWAAA